MQVVLPLAFPCHFFVRAFPRSKSWNRRAWNQVVSPWAIFVRPWTSWRQAILGAQPRPKTGNKEAIHFAVCISAQGLELLINSNFVHVTMLLARLRAKHSQRESDSQAKPPLEGIEHRPKVADLNRFLVCLSSICFRVLDLLFVKTLISKGIYHWNVTMFFK